LDVHQKELSLLKLSAPICEFRKGLLLDQGTVDVD